MQNKTAYIAIPKPWLDYLKRTGQIKPTIIKGKEKYFLDMTIDKNITIGAPNKADISLSK